LPAHQPPSLALRTLAALAGIVGLELVRYLAFRSEYQADPALWLVIAGSIAFNIWPPAARIVAKAIVALLKALAPLIAPR
jgi:hypothetical protein